MLPNLLILNGLLNLPSLVRLEVPVLPPHGADLEHVPNVFPSLLHLDSSTCSPGLASVHRQAGVSGQEP